MLAMVEKQKTITQAILHLRIHYGEHGIKPDVINTGECMDFAYEIARLGFGSDVWGNEVPDEFWSPAFQELIAHVEPMIGSQLITHFVMAHCFIEYQGKYYDSECPQGCNYPDQLPCYQRIMPYYFGDFGDEY